MAISDVLLEGRLAFRAYHDKGGEWRLKSENFSREVIYGWPLKGN